MWIPLPSYAPRAGPASAGSCSSSPIAGARQSRRSVRPRSWRPPAARASPASPTAGARSRPPRSPAPRTSPPAAGWVGVRSPSVASRSRRTAAVRRTGAGFEPASLTVPEVALTRVERRGEPTVRMTLAALARPDDVPEELLARLERRVGELHSDPLPLLDPAPDRALPGGERDAAGALRAGSRARHRADRGRPAGEDRARPRSAGARTARI